MYIMFIKEFAAGERKKAKAGKAWTSLSKRYMDKTWQATARLEQTFTRITGAEATRHISWIQTERLRN